MYTYPPPPDNIRGVYCEDFPLTPFNVAAASLDAGDWRADTALSDAEFGALQLDYSPSNPHPPLRRSPEADEDPPPKESLAAEKRVPRPRNAFMIFRSAFWAEQKINRTVEHDHRHISRIVGHCWNKMSDEDKGFWRRKADQEKVDHEMKHPGYRFCPTARTKKPIKRKVKRNGVDDLLRCEQVAELLLSGKQGKDLADAVNSLKPAVEDEPKHQVSPPATPGGPSEEPPFRSPLLPPLSLEGIPTTFATSTNSSPVGGSFPRCSISATPPPKPQHFTVINTNKPPESALFQTGPIPPLAYSVYHAQTATSMDTFDLSLDPIRHPPPRSSNQPRSVAALYDHYTICNASSAPPLPSPESSASTRGEPVEWNVAFPFST